MVRSNGPFSDGHYKDSRLGFCTKVVAQWLRVIMVCLITTHGLSVQQTNGKIDVWWFYTNLNLYYENPGIDVQQILQYLQKCTSICRCLASKEMTFAVFGKHPYRPFLSVTLQHASPKKSLAPCLQGSLPHVEEGWSTTRWARSCWSPWLLRIRSESCRACENCFCQLVALHINYA